MEITIDAFIRSDIASVWKAWNSPDDIMAWNSASPDWHTTSSTVDLRPGGKYSSRMEAKDGSMGFDFEGTYTNIIEHELIESVMSDGRAIKVQFIAENDGVRVVETFDAETENSPEMQRQGWQAILDNFGRYVEKL